MQVNRVPRPWLCPSFRSCQDTSSILHRRPKRTKSERIVLLQHTLTCQGFFGLNIFVLNLPFPVSGSTFEKKCWYSKTVFYGKDKYVKKAFIMYNREHLFSQRNLQMFDQYRSFRCFFTSLRKHVVIQLTVQLKQTVYQIKA